MFYGDLYPNEECYDPAIAQRLKRLMEARKKFAYGARTDYFTHPNCVGFVRHGNPERDIGQGGCAVLLSNADSDLPEKQERCVLPDCAHIPLYANFQYRGWCSHDTREGVAPWRRARYRCIQFA